MDRDRRYFIANTSSLAAGTPWTRERWRQLAPVDTNEEPERTELTIPIPKAAEDYYAACGKIDRHNRSRQDNLQLERKLGTKSWDTRVNFSILGMIVVDSWLAWKGIFGEDLDEVEKEFYEALAEELIDNEYNTRSSRRRARRRAQESESASPEAFGADGLPQSGIGPHLTPTRKKRKNTNHTYQGYCSVCRRKTIHVCSACRDANPESTRQIYLCSAHTGRTCFPVHVGAYHCSSTPVQVRELL